MNYLNCFFNYLIFALHIWTIFFILHLTKRYEVVCSQTCLSSWRYEDYDRLSVTKFFYVVISGFVHCCHSWAVMLLTESFKVNFDGYWSNSRPKIEKSILLGTKPLSNISTIGHGSWQAYHSHLVLFIHSRNNNLYNCSSILP